jgi:hypothetical protein
VFTYSGGDENLEYVSMETEMEITRDLKSRGSDSV